VLLLLLLELRRQLLLLQMREGALLRLGCQMQHRLTCHAAGDPGVTWRRQPLLLHRPAVQNIQLNLLLLILLLQ
jgi:hypothetical protein